MSRAALPTLGVVAAGRASPAVTRLLVDLGAWSRVSGDDSAGAEAWLALSPQAPALPSVAASGRPLAMWVEDESEAQAAMDWHPVAVVTASIGAARQAAQEAILVLPGPESALPRARPVPPFVRARLRRRLGHAAAMVADLRDATPEGGGDAVRVAAAVVATGDALLPALAWGAPAVTDAASAAALGARDGIEVVVAHEDPSAAAAALASDLRRAALLSRVGRRLAELRGADAAVPAKLARRLGIAAPPGAWRATVHAALQELSASPLEATWARVERACGSLERVPASMASVA